MSTKFGHDAVSLSDDFGPFEPIDWWEAQEEEDADDGERGADNVGEPQMGDQIGPEFVLPGGCEEGPRLAVGCGKRPAERKVVSTGSKGEADEARV